MSQAKRQKTDEKNDDEKGTRLHCIGCGDALTRDHTGIVCKNDHHICAAAGCARNFVNHKMSQGPSGIPVKCMNCNVDVVPSTFERNLPVEMQEPYAALCVLVGGKPAPGEYWHRCAFCPNMVILIESAGEMIFMCDNCRVAACMICSSKVRNDRQMEQHLLTCGAFGTLRSEFISIINRASQSVCPSCGHMGQKDGMCTHMTCPVCHARWCYVCERLRNDADGGEALHNSGWEANPARCPMWLNRIHTINASWPKIPAECVTYLHQRRIRFQLRQKVEEVGQQSVRRMLELFPAVLDNIPLGEILQAEAPRDF